MTDTTPDTAAFSNKAKAYRPRVNLDTDVYTLARQRAEQVLDDFDRVITMFSGGKDSTAVLNVTLDVAHSHPRHARHLPLRVVFYDEEAIPNETEQYVRRVARRQDIALEWYCIPLKNRNACSRRHPWWWTWDPDKRDLWCRDLPPEAITELPGFPIWPAEARLDHQNANGLFADPSHGNVALLMGIRAQESLIRQRAVTRKHVDNYINKSTDTTARGNLWKAYPIYDWTTEDVWTAPATFGWDYNTAYDRLAMAGVSASMQRCSPAFGEEPLQKLWTYASCFPEVWEKMTARVPGVGAAARYALTELYAYHGRPDKPTGMPWPDFLHSYLERYEPPVARGITDRIRTEIRSHYRKTADPILPTAPHPMTGLSWSFLLMLSMRGDFKNRKQPGGSILNDQHGRPLPKHWRRYYQELAGVLTEGRTADLAHPGRFPADPATVVPAYAKPEVLGA